MEHEYVTTIQYYIERYEDEKGEKVTKICVYRDECTQNLYIPHITRSAGCVNTRPTDAAWADVNLINYYMNTKYERVEGKKTMIFIKSILQEGIGKCLLQMNN